MGNNFREDYDILTSVDPIKDLDNKSIHISSSGIDWIPAPPLESIGLSPPQLLNLYFYMALTRKVDEEIVKFFRKGLAFGKHLSSIGNEATAVGAVSALKKEEWVATAIRDLGVFIVRGMPIYKIFCQACGRIDSPTQGWDGSLHMGDKDLKIAGLISHLGTMAPIASGCAFAERYSDTDNAVLVFCGDGTTSSGDVHEALNIASVLDLPMVMVIENNQWAFGTPNRLEFRVPTLALRSLGYGRNVEGYWIDGTKILTVYETIKSALEKARKEKTITIIEAASMRLEGHSLADPFTTYVPAEQLEEWKKKDPIENYKNLLSVNGVLTAEDFSQIDAQMKDKVSEAAIAAEKSNRPNAKNIESRVFVPSPRNCIELINPPSNGKIITYHQAIQETIREEMGRDPDLFIVGEDIGVSHGPFKITEGLLRHFDGIDWKEHWKEKGYLPRKRVIDAPLAEAGFCGLALGAVLAGLKAIVEFQYADFSSEAFKMLVNYAATQIARGFGPLPIVFRLPSGWAPNTSAYHSVNPESWFASTPGLKIVAPITAFDAKGMLRAAVRDGNPVLYLEYKGYYRLKPETLPLPLNLPIPEDDYIVPIGKARIVKEGKDLTVVSYSSQLFRVLEAVAEVEKSDGVSIEVIDLRTIVPYDKDAVSASVRKTNKVIVTCEAPATGCFGNTIVTNIIENDFDYLDAPVKLVAAADTPVPFAKELEEAHLPTTTKLILAIRELLAR